MSKDDRQSKILGIIADQKMVSVNKLSEDLKVSKVTIRKDLDSLQDKGLIERKHGSASLKSMDDISTRLAINYETKLRLASLAAESIDDGDIVMIESGSSCALLARILADTKKDIKIVTNSVFIATYLRDSNNVKVTLLGGEYQRESEVCVGPITREYSKLYSVDKIFLGTDGFNPDLGFTGGDVMRLEAARAMAESANSTILLTDSSKFNQKGLMLLFSFDEVDEIYTDDGISQEVISILEGNNIKVNIA